MGEESCTEVQSTQGKKRVTIPLSHTSLAGKINDDETSHTGINP